MRRVGGIKRIRALGWLDSDTPPLLWLCMVASEAVSDGLITYTHAVDELIMHRHTTL